MSLLYRLNKRQIVNELKSQIAGLMLLLCLMSLLLGACSRPAQGAEAEKKPKQVVTIETEGNKLEFDKSTLRAESGASIELTFNNNSTALKHNWVLVNGEEGVADQIYQEALAAGEQNAFLPDNAADLLAHTKFMAGGEKGAITFSAPTAPGDYIYLCTYPGHYLAGMKGTLTVSAP